MNNIVKKKMLAGKKTLGTFLELGVGNAAECEGLSGLDYLIIDNEHGPLNPENTLEIIRAARLYGIAPFARADGITRSAILKLLDAGAMGIVVPCVKTVEEARRIVEYGKYAPLGARGVGATAGSGYWYEDYAQHGLTHYFDVSNRETLLLPQCETRECLDQIEEIVAVEGIDGIFVGPFDLSTALGLPGDFDAPIVRKAIERVQKACHTAGKFSFIFAGTPERARAGFAMGYDSVTYGTDAAMLTDAYRMARQTILSE
jgi:4-hydroxy-2-oxoheptanedioate aldolase